MQLCRPSTPRCPLRHSGARRASGQCRADPDGQDFVTRIFGRVFGQETLTEPEPMGLKRMSEQDKKQLYPATTTEWADLLDSDTGELRHLRPMLIDTLLEDRPLRLAYDADRDGWSAEAFHAGVDMYGGALVVAETESGAKVGGFNPRGWIGLGEDRDAMNAFLFTWVDGDTECRPVRLPKVGNAAMAVIDRAELGPQFGPDGLKIALSPGRERLALSKLGSYYAKMPDGGKSLFGPGVPTRQAIALTALRVYVAEGDQERFELDGIIWKSSQA